MNYSKNYFTKWSRLCLAKEITNSLQSFESIIGIILISIDRFIHRETLVTSRSYGYQESSTFRVITTIII